MVAWKASYTVLCACFTFLMADFSVDGAISGRVSREEHCIEKVCPTFLLCASKCITSLPNPTHAAECNTNHMISIQVYQRFSWINSVSLFFFPLAQKGQEIGGGSRPFNILLSPIVE